MLGLLRMRPESRPMWRKRSSLFVSSVLVSTDMLAISASLLIALYWVGEPWSGRYLILLGYAIFVFLAIASLKQLYRSWRAGTIWREVLFSAEAWIAVFAMTFVTGYLWRDVALPDDVMLGWLLVTPVLLGLSRFSGRTVLRLLRRFGFNGRRLAIVGGGEVARHLARVIARSPWTGFVQIGHFASDACAQAADERDQSVRTLDELVDIVHRGEVDTVFIGVARNEPANWVNALVQRLSDSTVSVYLTRDRRSRDLSEEERRIPQPFVDPVLKSSSVLHRCWIDIDGIPALSVYESPFHGLSGWLKRLEDIVLATAILAAIALPMLAIAVGVKLSSPGPVLFKQRRYGLAGDEIIVWKFRSMTVCEDGEAVVQARKQDPRVTPFGDFLRRTSLDELPQFINVLQGTMSIIGPRPHAVKHNEQYRKIVDGYMLRHKVKPGITGLAQVRGFRGETDTLEKMVKRIESDLEYIRNWSLWLDVKILALTVFKGFRHANAY